MNNKIDNLLINALRSAAIAIVMTAAIAAPTQLMMATSTQLPGTVAQILH